MPETELPTDLLTPLGAYLTLREGARGSFLLESVERGRLGRYSFVGSGSRVVSFAEAEQLGEPVVGYLGYDAVATFEPTVALPDDGAGVPESLFLVPDVLLRFDHARGVAELLRGDATGLAGASPPFPAARRRAGRSSASRRATSTSAASSVRQEHIREGDVFQVVIAQRATRPTSAVGGRALTPGYWSYNGVDYYWVPGTWVEKLTSSPACSGRRDIGAFVAGAYVFNRGYWAPHVRLLRRNFLWLWL